MSRFKIEEGSHSGHCCFQFSVVDTLALIHPDRPHHPIENPHCNESLCECFYKEHAELMLLALTELYSTR